MEEDVFQHEETAAGFGAKVTGAPPIDSRSHTSKNQHRELVLRHRQHDPPGQVQEGLIDENISQDGSTDRPYRETPSPDQILNGADVDPFATMPVDLPPNIMALLMDQSTCRSGRRRNHADSILACSSGDPAPSGHEPLPPGYYCLSCRR